MQNTTKIEELNHLVQICQAGSEGFRTAAREVDNKEYRDWLLLTAHRRLRFAFELQDEIRKRKGQPVNNAGLYAGIHRTWMNFRHLINPDDDRVVLRECWRGEQHAVEAYEEMFERSSLQELQPILDQQFVSMVEMRNTLREEVLGNQGEKKDPSMLHLL